MTVGMIVALVVAIPILLVPAAVVWYINIGGVIQAFAEARENRVAGNKLP